MENWKAVFYLLASGQGILLSLGLLSTFKNSNKSNFFLGLILWVLSLELLNAWGMQVNYHSSPDRFPFWIFNSYLILPVALWLFIKINTDPIFKVKKKHTLLFLPSLMQIGIEIGVEVWKRLTGEFFYLLNSNFWYLLVEIVPIIGIVIVLIFYGKKLYKFYQLLKSNKVQATPLVIFKLFGLFVFFVAVTILWASGEFLRVPIYTIIEFLLMIFFFGIGYIGYFNPQFFSIPKIIKTSDPALFLNFEDEKELLRLKLMFEQNKIFLRSKLSLEELADELKLPTRYVSYLINTYYSTNFSNFVNGFRVNEVINKMNHPKEQHKTLLALALEAGFNSKSTFNQAFKMATGKSPSSYLITKK